MTPAGIEPATSRFVAQHLKHCATAVPLSPVTVSRFILSQRALIVLLLALSSHWQLIVIDRTIV